MAFSNGITALTLWNAKRVKAKDDVNSLSFTIENKRFTAFSFDDSIIVEIENALDMHEPFKRIITIYFKDLANLPTLNPKGKTDNELFLAFLTALENTYPSAEFERFSANLTECFLAVLND